MPIPRGELQPAIYLTIFSYKYRDSTLISFATANMTLDSVECPGLWNDRMRESTMSEKISGGKVGS